MNEPITAAWILAAISGLFIGWFVIGPLVWTFLVRPILGWIDRKRGA